MEKNYPVSSQNIFVLFFVRFFGRIENYKKWFRDLLTFNRANKSVKEFEKKISLDIKWLIFFQDNWCEVGNFY